MKAHRHSDEELLRGVRDPSSFAEFYRRHERTLLSYFARATTRTDLAVDLTAESFARAFQQRGSFDPGRGTPAGWLFGIARYVLIDSVRARRVEASARAQL